MSYHVRISTNRARGTIIASVRDITVIAIVISLTKFNSSLESHWTLKTGNSHYKTIPRVLSPTLHATSVYFPSLASVIFPLIPFLRGVL